jgi:hypothetical protein
MNFKKSALASAITLATFATGAAAFDASSWEVSGFVKNETAALQGSGTFHGQQSTTSRATGYQESLNDSGDVIKFENTAKLFVNGDLTENAALHAELNFVYDTEATPNDYQGHMNYSQNDYLRELYVDTMIGDTEVRVGKQQVVWGTADGIKLLDIINPTDYREFAQNTMEDSRIPIWMVKTDTPVGDAGSFQFVLSQAEENKIAGLNASGDQGNPFIMKGVDSITGKVNGFLNVTPALGAVAGTFDTYAQGGAFETGPANTGYGASNITSSSLAPFASLTVDGFAGNVTSLGSTYGYTSTGSAFYSAGQSGFNASSRSDGITLMDGIAQGTNSYVTNLTDSSTAWAPATANSAFEFMPMATFATFNTFSGATSKYVRDYPSDSSSNYGFRFKNSLDNGFNFSVNYFRHYDSNPYIDLSWRDASTGERLEAVYVEGGEQYSGLPYIAGSGIQGTVRTADTLGTSITSFGAYATDSTTQAQAAAMATYYNAAGSGTGTSTAADWAPYVAGGAKNATTVLLRDAATQSNYYGSRAWDGTSSANTTAYQDPELRFTEKLNRIHSLGASFDYTVDSESLGGVVLRGEFLYNKDEMSPVIDKRVLAIGDLAGALRMQKGDTFKYVLGADITVLTNMLVSGQFIQMRNLDYVEENRTCTTQFGATIDCSRYTGDMATLHMSNGLQKAEENKEFYSLFFSKPFGPNQLGRWNNIFMFEEGGGKWNRFDVEYSFSDELVGSFELNNYWGDANTQFGQMEDSSNIQVGLKYLF